MNRLSCAACGLTACMGDYGITVTLYPFQYSVKSCHRNSERKIGGVWRQQYFRTGGPRSMKDGHYSFAVAP
jgi:hypothetical protein